MEFVPRATSKMDLPTSTIIRKEQNSRSSLYNCDNSVRFSALPGSNFATKQMSESVFFKHDITDRAQVDWARPTELLCWHCCHSFDNPPFPLPKSYDIRERCYIVTGNFCCLGCVKAYIYDNNTFDVSQVLTTFARMVNEVYDVDKVLMSPPRHALKCFGGNLTIEKFRNNTKIVQIHEAPFISNYMVIEEKLMMANNVTESWKQSIRGLRRPAQPVSIAQEGRERSMYDDFVEAKMKEKGVDLEIKDVEKATSTKGGLSAFMK